jgi:hypothetical protein
VVEVESSLDGVFPAKGTFRATTPIRVYLHAPVLPNTERSLNYITRRLTAVGLGDQVIECASDPALFEYPTLHRLWQDAQHEDFCALYLHTKGASKTEERDLLNAEAWIDFMLYGVVDNWRTSMEHLDRGADLVGSEWYWHFKGNFWWGKSSYLRHLPNPKDITGNMRFNAEYWCAWGLWKSDFPKPAVKNLFYVQGLDADSMFSAAREHAFPPALDRREIFIDRRLDASHPETIEEFLARRYFRAFDEIHILEGSAHLCTQLKDYLNYDGRITFSPSSESPDSKFIL